MHFSRPRFSVFLLSVFVISVSFSAFSQTDAAPARLVFSNVAYIEEADDVYGQELVLFSVGERMVGYRDSYEGYPPPIRTVVSGSLTSGRLELSGDDVKISGRLSEPRILVASVQRGASGKTFSETVKMQRKELPWTMYRPRAGYVPDAANALKIAEAIFVAIYGDQVLQERPFTAKLDNDVWTVSGTLRCPDGKGGYTTECDGGVAEAKIKKDDGGIVSVVHGK